MEVEIKENKSKTTVKKLIRKILKNKIGRIICLVLVAVIVIITVMLCLNNWKSKVNTTSLISTLQKSSELTTAKLTFRGLAEYEDSGIKILNRADYKVLFKATARIGIDIEKVDIDKDLIRKNIIVKIPKATVLDVKIHTGKDDMIFYDEAFALFNLDEKEDQNTLIELAEKSAMKEIQEMGSLKMADDQSAALIKGILANAVPDGYEIIVKQHEEP